MIDDAPNISTPLLVYRLVALETHPDKVVGDAAAKTRAAERFRRAQKAYATLGDKEKRVAYDRM